jgi:hypothetical protein
LVILDAITCLNEMIVATIPALRKGALVGSPAVRLCGLNSHVMAGNALQQSGQSQINDRRR